MMDLKELRYFRAIAEYGTFSKAAARLRVAQPALSRQMQKLEHKLGVELLRRTSRGVTPTEAGLVLLQKTRQLEHDLEMTQREVSKFATEVRGNLRVAVFRPFSTLMIPGLLKTYRHQCPGVAVHVIEGYSADLTNGLLGERIDVAICQAPSHAHPDLTVVPLFVERLDLVGPAGAAKDRLFRGPVSIEQLADLPLILPSQIHGIRRLTEAAFGSRHLKLTPCIEADGPLMIYEMVKAGLGLTIMPHAGYFSYLQAGEVVVTTTEPPIFRTTALVTRKSLLHDRGVVPFIDLVKVAVPRLVATPRFGKVFIYGADGAEPPPQWHAQTPPLADASGVVVPLTRSLAARKSVPA